MSLKYRQRLLFIGLGIGYFFWQLPVSAQEYFNPYLLETEDTTTPSLDLSLFTEEVTPPGDYNVDVYINNNLVDTRTLSFKINNEAKPSTTLEPCLSLDQLSEWNIRVENYPDLAKGGGSCARLDALPGMTLKLQLSHQRLDLGVAQVAMRSTARGFIPPEKWDEGINAALLNYNLSGQTTTPRGPGVAESSQFVSLQPGVNIGPWRFRNYSTFNRDSDERRWDSLYSHVSRDIRSLKGQLVMGRNNTQPGIFDSINFTGAEIYSDTEMLPESLQGFAPIIRGVAQTQAEVTVYQNGYSIYKSIVPPGAFEINDMYPTGSAGDLRVVVKESDGSEHSFIVPYASLPVLQREGQLRYEVAGGKTHSENPTTPEFSFVQSSLAWGLSNGITAYGGGIQAEDKYSNILAGFGVNLGSVGALSLDLSQSWTQLKDFSHDNAISRESGQSWRLRYSKTFQQTGTDFSMAGYRYSTSGYYSFSDFTNAWSREDDGNEGRQQNRVDVSLSQNTNLGAFTLSLISESYWDQSRTHSLNFGYSNSWHSISYFLNYAYNHNVAGNNDDENEPDDNTVSLSLSIPFNAFSKSDTWRSISANYAVNTSKKGGTTHSAGLSGSVFDDHSLSWQVTQGYTTETSQNSGNVNIAYQSALANLSAGYGYDDYSDRYSYGINGGAVLHSGGVTLSRSLSETVALVQVPGVKNVPIFGQTNMSTDRFGNAVIPYVRPYHLNAVSIDTQYAMDADADIENVMKTVVPTRGAVVRARYQTRIGLKSMMTMTHQGAVVPFGAIVTTADSANDESHSAIVGDEGQVYLTGLEPEGILQVKWGEDANKTCQVHYSLTHQPPEGGSDIIFYHAQCL